MTGFAPLFLPGHALAAGFVPPNVAEPLVACGLLARGDTGLHLLGDGCLTAALDAACTRLAEVGVIGAARQEVMPVRVTPDGPVVAVVDRSALRAFGFWAHKVHLNGLRAAPTGGAAVWLSRRALRSRSHPGAFDTLVAGGVPSHLCLDAALADEAAAEAGIGLAMLARATPAGRWPVTYVAEEFLHREVLVVHDLWLPPDFEPFCSDGEIEESILVPWPVFCAAAGEGADFKPNSRAVCRDLVRRLGTDAMISEGRSPEALK